MPARHFLQYWKPAQVDKALARQVLDYAGGGQLGKVRAGDVVWIVTTRGRGRLVTIGPIVVGRQLDAKGASKALGRRIWLADHHIIARKDARINPTEVSLQALVTGLVFHSTTAPNLKVVRGIVNAQQLQTIRKLTPDSARLLTSHWEDKTGQHLRAKSRSARDETAGALRRYCRICWNTQLWRRPTGEAQRLESGNSYVVVNGFGHEEWLANTEWTVNDWRHIYLQPISKFRDRYLEKDIDITLYTVGESKTRYLVGELRGARVLDKDEAENVRNVYQKNGWLGQMADDLRRIGIDGRAAVTEKSPADLFNLAFRTKNIEFYDPFVPVPREHKLYRLNRYHPMLIDPAEDRTRTEWQEANLKSTDPRTRAEQEGTTFEPRHDKLQNALYKQLCQQYGRSRVGYEKGRVDIQVLDPTGRCTLYEIKMENSVRGCVRLALGQLLEYAFWGKPDRRDDLRLVVVGEYAPAEDDVRYVKALRRRFKLPVYYQQYDWSTRELKRAV